MKYLAPCLLFLPRNEILSLFALLILGCVLLTDLMGEVVKHGGKEGWR